MQYEVVDPNKPRERGPLFRTLADAMVSASPTLEVWVLADDDAQTRMVMVWPDVDPPGKTDTALERAETIAAAMVARAQREAAAIIAESGAGYTDALHSICTLAWAQGYAAGFEDGGDGMLKLLDAIHGKVTA